MKRLEGTDYNRVQPKTGWIERAKNSFDAVSRYLDNHAGNGRILYKGNLGKILIVLKEKYGDMKRIAHPISAEVISETQDLSAPKAREFYVKGLAEVLRGQRPNLSEEQLLGVAANLIRTAGPAPGVE